MNFQFHTFGCKVNTYDTGLMQKNLQSVQWPVVESAVHVLNSCAVTAEASKEALKMARRLKSKDPLCKVILTGCAAQVDTELFTEFPAIDLVVANSHKSQLPQIMEDYFKGKLKTKVLKSNIFRLEDLGSGGGSEKEHTRSFLKIQDGCNQFCSYCVIPYARGKSRSLSISELVQKVNALSQAGVREVVLTGVHIADYQDEKSGGDLQALVEMLLSKTQNVRFRLSSLEPLELSKSLLSLYKDKRLCPHFHMSIQSADTDVLKAMKRKYTAQDVAESLQMIREFLPQAYIGMDVITGFPVETDEAFARTLKLLESTPWTRLHVFPYSERPGTKAAALTEQVPMEERKARAKVLRHLSLNRLISEAKKQLGSVKEVLVLEKNPDSVWSRGLSQDYWAFDWQNDESSPAGEIKQLQAQDIHINLQKQDVTLRAGLI